MDHDTLQLIMGLIFLVLIVNTMVIWSIATASNPLISSTLPIDSPALTSSKSSPSPTVSPDTTKASTVTPTVTPVKTQSVVSPVTPTPVPTPKSYVEIVAPIPVAVETHQQLQPDLLKRSEEGYTILYSLSNRTVSEQMEDIIIDVVNPPLFIDYQFVPLSSKDVKLLEYKKLSTYYHENVTTNRPFEDAWFMVNVTDNDTQEIIIQDGVGRTFGLLSEKQLLIPNNGKIRVALDGLYGNINLTIKMRDPAK